MDMSEIQLHYQFLNMASIYLSVKEMRANIHKLLSVDLNMKILEQ